MILYPAIDIKNGKCVRLRQGKFDDVTVYGDDPVMVAEQWASQGGEFLHIVDLDGALEGETANKRVISKIASSVKVPIEVGGGIRTMETIENYLKSGIARVILGTAALQNESFLKEALQEFQHHIAVGIDAKDGYAATHGWETVSRVKGTEFGEKVADMGAETIIYTDIATDGMLTGPNLDGLTEMIYASGINVIASGGISSVEDILNVQNCGAAGVIIGKALYTKQVDLPEALRKVSENDAV